MIANRCGTVFNAMLHKAANRCIGLRAFLPKLNFCQESDRNKSDKASKTGQDFKVHLENNSPTLSSICSCKTFSLVFMNYGFLNYITVQSFRLHH